MAHLKMQKILLKKSISGFIIWLYCIWFEGHFVKSHSAPKFVMLFVHSLNFSTFVSGNRTLTLNTPRCSLLSRQLPLSQFLPLPLLTTQLHPNKFNVLQERGGLSYINSFPQQNSVNISDMLFQLVSKQYIVYRITIKGNGKVIPV